jgi:hypothetical protein
LKQNNKAKLLFILLLLQAIIANAKEGIVLRTISSPTESKIMLDTTKDGKEDMYILIPLNVDPKALYGYIRALFARGSKVEIDDDYILNDGKMDFAYLVFCPIQTAER